MTPEVIDKIIAETREKYRAKPAAVAHRKHAKPKHWTVAGDEARVWCDAPDQKKAFRILRQALPGLKREQVILRLKRHPVS